MPRRKNLEMAACFVARELGIDGDAKRLLDPQQDDPIILRAKTYMAAAFFLCFCVSEQEAAKLAGGENLLDGIELRNWGEFKRTVPDWWDEKVFNAAAGGAFGDWD